MSGGDLDGAHDIPGAFPETPGNELEFFSVNPMAASSSMRDSDSLSQGGRVPQPSDSTGDATASEARDDVSPAKESEEQQSFGVAPIPASSGIGNPVHLAPGEAVPNPNTISSNTVESTVRTDPESYDRSDAAPQVGSAATPESERPGRSETFGSPEVRTNLIPESSLPMGKDVGTPTETDPGYTVQSAGPESTTAMLAGQVPRESRGVPQVVEDNSGPSGPPQSTGPGMGEQASSERQSTPEVVRESHEDAYDGSETALNAGSMAGKKGATQQDQRQGDFEEPSDVAGRSKDVQSNTDKDESSMGLGGIAAMAASGVAAAGTAVAAAVSATKDKALEAAGYTAPKTSGQRVISSDVQRAIDEMNAGHGDYASSGIPEPVVHSIQQSHESPEAAANPEAVSEKEAMERELLSKVRSKNEVGEQESAPSAVGTVPAVVADSIRRAHEPPEAAINPEAVAEKEAVENELLSKVKSADVEGQTGPSGVSLGAVPAVVSQSFHRSHESPEAAANPEAVSEKEAVESELLSKVRTTDAKGEPAPGEWSTSSVPPAVTHSFERAHVSPEAAINPVAVTEKHEMETQLLHTVKRTDAAGEHASSATGNSSVPVPPVPEIVSKSIDKSHESPEAASNPEAVMEKTAVESELLSTVKPKDEAGEPAPTITADTSATLPLQSTSGNHTSKPAPLGPIPYATAPSPGTTSMLSPISMTDAEPLRSSQEVTTPSTGNETRQPTTFITIPPLAGSIASGLSPPKEASDQSSSTEGGRLPTFTGPSLVLPPVVPASMVGAPTTSNISSLDPYLERSAAPAASTSSGLNGPMESAAQSVVTETSHLAHEPAYFAKGKDVSRDISPSTSVPATMSQLGPQVTTGVAESQTPRLSQVPPSNDTVTPSKSTNYTSSSPSASPSTPQNWTDQVSTPQKTAAQRAASGATASSSRTPQSIGGGSVSGTPASAKTSMSSSSVGGASGVHDGEKKKKRHSIFGKLKEKLHGDKK